MIKNIGLVGAGAVGSVMISRLYQVYPENFYLLARGARAKRLEEGISVNDRTLKPKIYSEAAEHVKLDLLIVAVKNYSLERVIEDVRPLIDRETIILPLLNGIMATQRLQAAFPENRVFYGVMLRTDAHRTGHRVYFSTPGEIQMGYADNRIIMPEVQEVYECLKNAGVNARIYEDMRRIQWRKWMLNTAGSQAAVEAGVECGYFSQVSEIVELMSLCMDEILQLAEAEGVNLTRQDKEETLTFLLGYPAHKKMSMLQDVEAGRPIEIDEYAGTAVELGKKHDIATPVNRVLYLTIKAREKVDAIRKHM
ncbi:MAG: 2-dehydropantoate 2-reductase [Eubacteriales bacterium]|nr:2-dehydropantoate 2-reductase [Eubacteriales bacterium]